MVLSSSTTFFQKYILPLALPCFFGTLVWYDIIHPMLTSKGVSLADAFGNIFILSLMAIIIYEVLRNYICIKRVSIYQNTITISNYFREATIRLEFISNVSWSRLHNVIIVTFNGETGFGNRITFRPKLKLWFFKDHPTVEDIKKAVEVAKTQNQ